LKNGTWKIRAAREPEVEPEEPKEDDTPSPTHAEPEE